MAILIRHQLCWLSTCLVWSWMKQEEHAAEMRILRWMFRVTTYRKAQNWEWVCKRKLMSGSYGR